MPELSIEQIAADEKLEREATPAPWVGKQEIRHTGMTSCYPVVTITATEKPNKSYPRQPGIVAMLEGCQRFEPTKAMTDEDLAVMIAMRNHAPAYFAAARDAIKFRKIIFDMAVLSEAGLLELPEPCRETLRAALAKESE